MSPPARRMKALDLGIGGVCAEKGTSGNVASMHHCIEHDYGPSCDNEPRCEPVTPPEKDYDREMVIDDFAPMDDAARARWEKAPEPRESGKREHRERFGIDCTDPAQREKEHDGRSGVQSDASGTVSSAGATPASSLSTPAADEQGFELLWVCSDCPHLAAHHGASGCGKCSCTRTFRCPPPRADSPAKREWTLRAAGRVGLFWLTSVDGETTIAGGEHRVVDAEWAEKEIERLKVECAQDWGNYAQACEELRAVQASAAADRERVKSAAELFKRLRPLRIQSQDASCMGTTTVAGIEANRAAVAATQRLYDDADAWLLALSDPRPTEEPEEEKP